MATLHGDPAEDWICAAQNETDAIVHAESGQESESQKLVGLSDRYWPYNGSNLDLGVYFMQPPPKNFTEDGILSFMKEWEESCGVKFVKTNYIHESKIRITFEGNLNHSYIGTDAEKYTNKSTMNLGKVSRRSVLHETGHALGFIHEHQHPYGNIQWNKQKVLADCLNLCGWNERMVNTNIFGIFDGKSTHAPRELDPHSIMAYSLRKEWVHNPEDEGVCDLFKLNIQLSDLDKQLVREVYPKPLIQPHDSPDSQNTVSNAAMKKAMQNVLPRMIDLMCPTSSTFQGHLIKCNVLNDEDRQLLMKEPTRKMQNHFIFNLMGQKGKKGYLILFQCLKETKDDEPAHEDLIEIIEEKLKQ